MAACCSCGKINEPEIPAAVQGEAGAQALADATEKPGVSDKDAERFAEELGITDTESLRESVDRLHEKGCGSIMSLTKTGENGGWYYLYSHISL